jgi:Fur family ferric uptake transcriptional regulator
MTDADRHRAAGSPARYQAGAGAAVSPASYHARVVASQHHIVCRACGAVAEVDRVAGPTPCLEPGTGAGFAIDEAEVTFWGLCPRCRATMGGPGAPAAGRS